MSDLWDGLILLALCGLWYVLDQIRNELREMVIVAKEQLHLRKYG